MAISFRGAKNYTRHNGFSKSAKIKKALPAPLYRYSLSQDDIILTPLVSEGDYVLKGQKLADIEEFNAVPVYSSVSGKITSVTDSFIIAENDMLFTRAEVQRPDGAIESLTSREKLWIMREAAVCEVRTGTPVHVLLSHEQAPDCIIVCCFDSDPYVSSPQMITLGNTRKILDGLDIVMNIVGVKRAVVAVETETKKNFSDFKLNLRYNTNIELIHLKSRYPQSRDDILTRTCTGRSPENINALILSSETLINIASIFKLGRPVTSKLVTVSGDDILTPSNILAPIGLSIASLLSDCGYTAPAKVIVGGVADGKEITDLDTPITASTSSVAAFNNISNIPKYRKELI